MPVSMPINTLKGNWQRLIKNDRLKRSSQVLSVVDNHVCIFGGEVQPRQPVDDKIDVLQLDSAQTHSTKSPPNAPTPRVGTASAVLNNALYLFSGRGGPTMSPLDEHGTLWSYTPSTSTWTSVTPSDPSAAVPPPRSYHCTTSDGQSTIYIHAGCPSSGRLSDLWAFDTSSRTWTELPSAPGPQRGGTSIAFHAGKLYRMHGFDGTSEQGGSVDVFNIATKEWSSKTFKADGTDGPEARSVCVVLPVRLGRKDKLLTLFGERDPSSLGHEGAGKMLADVWVWDISEEWWTRLEPEASSGEQEGSGGKPDPRGWFDADVVKSETLMGNDSIIIHGGLGEDNERLNDVWLLKF